MGSAVCCCLNLVYGSPKFRRIYMPRCLFCSRSVAVVFAAVCLTFTSATYGQNAAGPQPVPLPPAVPAPVDKPYAGTILLSVDLTNVNDRVLNVHENIP